MIDDERQEVGFTGPAEPVAAPMLSDLAREFLDAPKPLLSWAPAFSGGGAELRMVRHAWEVRPGATGAVPEQTVCGLRITMPTSFGSTGDEERCPDCAAREAAPLAGFLRLVAKSAWLKGVYIKREVLIVLQAIITADAAREAGFDVDGAAAKVLEDTMHSPAAQMPERDIVELVTASRAPTERPST